MLRALTIKHFAIIDQAELELEPGFCVITGETGAGKSILVDALSLLIGQRADAGVVAKGQNKADLSAYFELTQASPALKWLQSNAMAEEDQTVVIRRTIQATGGSRAWINGHPASASQLKDLGAMLIEIHGQHAHQQLSKTEHQRQLVDTQCPKKLIDAVVQAHRLWHEAKLSLEQFEADMGDPSQLDLLTFQVKELEELALEAGEFVALEAEQERLQRQDEIQLAIQSAAASLDQDDGTSARRLLLQASQAIAPITELDARLANVATLLEEAVINLSEARSELEQLATEPDQDPERLSVINTRMTLALDLARKHRVRPEELPALADSLASRLEKIQDQDQQRALLTNAIKTTEAEWQRAAGALSQARRSAAKALSASVTKALSTLGMAHATLEIHINPNTDRSPSPKGFDEVAIAFSANPGQPPQPLSKVASGGELSRISLALTLAAGSDAYPMTRVFDEVDAGIGGETAHAVGDFLARVGKANPERSQALCVTHLAQVAARANHQFQVNKTQTNQTNDKKTAIEIRLLSHNDRETEIARMLGDAHSKTSLAHARELLETHHLAN